MNSRNFQITTDLFFVGAWAVIMGGCVYYHSSLVWAFLMFVFFLVLSFVHISQAQMEDAAAAVETQAQVPAKPACPPHAWEMENGRYRCQTPGCRVFPG